MHPSGGAPSRSDIGFLAAIFLTALALRPQIIGLGPLLPRIQTDLGISHGAAGLLATIPMLCMGVFAPLTPFVARQLGPRRAITACLVGIGLFGLGRAVVPGAGALIALTVGVGVAVGIAGALLPVAVKERYAHRPATATGVYASGIQVGAAVSALVAVPIAQLVIGWRASLAVFSLVTLLIAAVWWRTRRGGRPPTADFALPRPPLGSGLAWLLVALFFLQSVPYWGLSAWLPAYLIEHGWREAPAGAALALLTFTSIPGTLFLPALADRYGSRRLYLVVSSSVALVCLVGMLMVPALTWVWSGVAGVFLGVLFALALTLPLDVAERPVDVGAVAGMVLGVGYAVSALAPSGLGLVRDVTGSFAASMWVLVGVTAVLLVVGATLTPERLSGGVRTAAGGRRATS